MSIHAFTSVTHRHAMRRRQLGGRRMGSLLGRLNISKYLKGARKRLISKSSRKAITDGSKTAVKTGGNTTGKTTAKRTKKQLLKKGAKSLAKGIAKQGLKAGVEVGTALAVDQLMNGGPPLTASDVKRTAAHASLNLAENVINGATGSSRQHITSGLRRAKPGETYGRDYYSKKVIRRAGRRAKSSRSMMDIWNRSRSAARTNRTNLYGSQRHKFGRARLFGTGFGVKKGKKGKKKKGKKTSRKGKKKKKTPKKKKKKARSGGIGLKLMNVRASKRRQEAMRDIFSI